ncbi:FtsB family cell division protein [Candidatus Oscillochloris fontis]|uniref:FtsB family cell division protein n=1 Tax=Candidatus Oscillochloris fontis TaxID=2496868 RepID=UPI00101B7643|nr:septum formation initiator family protein [Candidatus Oscillochloris fontis]
MKAKRPHATRRILPNWRHVVRRRSAVEGHTIFARLAALARSGGRGLASLLVGAVMLTLIGLLIANFIGQVMLSARLEAQRAALAAEVDQIRAENRQLEAAVDFAESDANVERIAREQLGYARDGDMVLMVQTPPPLPTTSASSDGSTLSPLPPEPPAPNWHRWWTAFFPVS